MSEPNPYEAPQPAQLSASDAALRYSVGIANRLDHRAGLMLQSGDPDRLRHRADGRRFLQPGRCVGQPQEMGIRQLGCSLRDFRCSGLFLLGQCHARHRAPCPAIGFTLPMRYHLRTLLILVTAAALFFGWAAAMTWEELDSYRDLRHEQSSNSG